MNLEFRSCSMCRGQLKSEVFPYKTIFNGQTFEYRKCSSCGSVIVATVPSEDTFSKMYAKKTYHDNHYANLASTQYDHSVRLLAKHVAPASIVLDYGCGTGAFLKSLSSFGLHGYGLEFNDDAANEASRKSGCKVYGIADLEVGSIEHHFDAIHLGDVLEHLPDPISTLNQILNLLKPDGILFIEGPLETNCSLVYTFAKTFGFLKQKLHPQFIRVGAPTHLIRTNAQAQRKFVQHLQGIFEEQHWRVYETGWPYAYGGPIKRLIATIAQGTSNVASFFGFELGNRFESIYIHKKDIIPNPK